MFCIILIITFFVLIICVTVLFYFLIISILSHKNVACVSVLCTCYYLFRNSCKFDLHVHVHYLFSIYDNVFLIR